MPLHLGIKPRLVAVLAAAALTVAACTPEQQAAIGTAQPPAEPRPAEKAQPPAAPAQPAAQPKTAAPPAEKTTVTLAYLEDPSRDTALYGITQGFVRSDLIDIELTFLPLPAAVEAHQTRQYDVIETSPIAVAAGAGAGFRTLITSAALENEAGTLLWVPADSPITDPSDLRDKTIGLASLGGTFALEARYVLQEKYGLNTDPQSGDVRWQEIPPDVALGLLREDRLDAAVLLHMAAYVAEQEPGVRLLANLTEEFVELTGRASMNSVMITYPEVAQEKGPAIAELNRMLRDSEAYVNDNRDQVVQAVAAQGNIPADFLTWWWERYRYPHGSLTDQHKEEIVTIWEVARSVGQIQQVPNIEELVFRG